jgi:hypothetical protein
VTICEHMDQSWSIRYGPHVVGRYNAQVGTPMQRFDDMEMTKVSLVLRIVYQIEQIPPGPWPKLVYRS